jgi:hypothetical protein
MTSNENTSISSFGNAILVLTLFTCLTLVFSYTTNKLHHDIRVSNKSRKPNLIKSVSLAGPIEERKHSLRENIIKLSECMKFVLKDHSKDLKICNDFIESLLRTREEYVETARDVTNYGDNGAKRQTSPQEYDEFYNNYIRNQIEMIQDSDGSYILVLKGLPHRPFYLSLSARIIILTELFHTDNLIETLKEMDTNDGLIETIELSKSPVVLIRRPLIDATNFGLTERTPLPTFVPFFVNQSYNFTPESVMNYLNTIQTRGILEYLGLRTTIGSVGSDESKFSKTCGFCSEKYLNYVPDVATLLQAANQPCTPNANPPRLTDAGRARAKHAHRGIVDQYFGVVKGSTLEKNAAASKIVSNMIHNALWINIHVFGGVDDPVLEIRTKEGYGARWSIIMESFRFRGFLEPQMLDGFEKKWKH